MKNVQDKFASKNLAANYDAHIRRVVPAYELMVTISVATCKCLLAADARILIVGAGTGFELFELANANPNWRFVAIDTALPMLELAQKRCQDFSGNIEYIHGDINTLPIGEKFTAAIALLLLNFSDNHEKLTILNNIARHCQPDAPLLLSQRLQTSANLFANIEVELASNNNLAANMLAIMPKRIAAMPLANNLELQQIYKNSKWQHQQRLCQILDYQLELLQQQ